MAFSRLEHVRLSGICVCAGPEEKCLEDEKALFGNARQEAEKLRRLVGLDRRRVVPPGVTTLDLGEAAARRLLAASGVDPAEIDALVFVTQTPDLPQPCNANLLHGRLGLGKGAAVFDVNQGCSGWVYGLWLAHLMVSAGGCRKILLLAGDTITRLIHPLDRATLPLFGDACSATLVVREENAPPAWFALHSDGAGAMAIHVPHGGARSPSAPGEILPEKTDADGSVRTAAHLHMNGLEVFNFTLREEPAAVRELLAYAGKTVEETDAFVFHQANAFILQNLAKRLRLPAEKVPLGTTGRYGNQSSASIPAALCDELGPGLESRGLRLLCSGFGVGLSWASCWLEAGPLACAQIFAYQTPQNPA